MSYCRIVMVKLMLLSTAITTVHAQCGFLAGTVTDITGTMPLAASISAQTSQGKLRLGKTNVSGVFNVPMPCNVSGITIESAQYQSLRIPVNNDGKPEGTYFATFALLPLGKQASDEPYAQSEQRQFELKDSTRTLTSIVRRIEVKDALSGASLPADICLYYTQKQKKDCFSLLALNPSVEVIFTEKDIVALEVKSSGYQGYNGNLILDKTDQEPRTYSIKLSKLHTIISVNIVNAQAGIQCRLITENQTEVPLIRINDGHYFAEVIAGKSYQVIIDGGGLQKEFAATVASVKEGLTLKSFRLPEKETTTIRAATLESENLTAKDKILYFPRSEYKLPEESRAYLDSVAYYILGSKNKGLRITGHTDNVGNADLNLTLSQYRVKVITRYLVNKGVSEAVITAKGVGSKYPLRPNDSEENRRQNRCVEVQIVDLQGKNN